MLVVHWTPVKNTKHILKNGITKSKHGVYCFPLTGDKFIDKFWARFFNQSISHPKQRFNGIVFRLTSQDLPAYFGHWIGATNRDKFDKPIRNLKSLENDIRDMLYWRVTEYLLWKSSSSQKLISQEFMINYAKNALESQPNLLNDILSDSSFLQYIYEDLQIVLSNSISAKRIIKVIPQGNEFGRILKNKKRLAMLE